MRERKERCSEERVKWDEESKRKRGVEIGRGGKREGEGEKKNSPFFFLFFFFLFFCFSSISTSAGVSGWKKFLPSTHTPMCTQADKIKFLLPPLLLFRLFTLFPSFLSSPFSLSFSLVHRISPSIHLLPQPLSIFFASQSPPPCSTYDSSPPTTLSPPLFVMHKLFCPLFHTSRSLCYAFFISIHSCISPSPS